MSDRRQDLSDDEGPVDLPAVHADGELIDALAAGLVPPPSGPVDLNDVDAALTALLAGWVADVRPETLIHRPGQGAEVSFVRKTRDGRHRIELTVSAGPSSEEHAQPTPSMSMAMFVVVEGAQFAFFVIVLVLVLLLR